MTSIRVYREFTLPFTLFAEVNISAESVTISTTTKHLFQSERTSTSTILWSDLQAREDKCGFDRWILPLDSYGNQYQIRNLHVETYASQLQPTEQAGLTGSINLFHIITRPTDTSFLDSHFYINISDEGSYTCNLPVEELTRTLTTGRKFYWPSMELLETSRTSDKVTCEVRMDAAVSNQPIYLETDLGYVTKEVTVQNGTAQFSFIPVEMNDGDVATVKAGFKYFSDVASISITR
jgi:hypothetical protein